VRKGGRDLACESRSARLFFEHWNQLHRAISMSTESDRIFQLLGEAKRLAQEYHRLTGKPLGITGEVAEFETARILGVKLTPARQAGYDAIETRDGTERQLQIKGRCLLENCKPGQRLGSIRIDKEWHAVLMVLLDQNYDATEIYEAERPAVESVLKAPPYSKARHERGAMAVSKFKAIGHLRWKLGPANISAKGCERQPTDDAVVK
jgi:hypothetical protein